MDIMLSNIIALIGNRRGAKKELADYLGISQNVFTSWFALKSESYKKYAPQIAEHYGVSLDWLSGNSDIREIRKPVTPENNGLSELDIRIMQSVPQLTEEEKRIVFAQIKGILSSRE